jgi:hypothetical protein
MMSASDDDVRKEALFALMAEFVKQGHPAEYAKYMAMASIFQADLDLRNAQFSGLLHWLQTQHEAIYPEGLKVAEGIRKEFENRIQQHS